MESEKVVRQEREQKRVLTRKWRGRDMRERRVSCER